MLYVEIVSEEDQMEVSVGLQGGIQRDLAEWSRKVMKRKSSSTSCQASAQVKHDFAQALAPNKWEAYFLQLSSLPAFVSALLLPEGNKRHLGPQLFFLLRLSLGSYGL